MEALEIPWSNWCRLCANNDSDNNFNIPRYSGKKGSSTNGDDYLNIKDALEKYFWVHSSDKDILPKHLCSDCNSVVSSIIVFNERVDRVQQMYKYLVKNFGNISLNIMAVRETFKVCDDSKEFRYIGNRSVVEIEEDWTMDTDQPDSIGVNVTLNGEEDITKSCNDEEPGDDTMSEDSIWGDDRDEPIKDKVKVKSNKIKICKLSLAKGNKILQREKKPLNEDFLIDIACTQCGLKFHLYSDYCDHMEMEHNCLNTEKFCPICSRNLGTWYHLGRHMRSHMPLERRFPIKCPECDSRFTTSALLETHINHKHKSEKPFICEICGFCGPTKTSLSHHMNVHTDDAPFECNVCHKKFKMKSKLNFHMDIHAPHKFVCTICGLQLNSRATLKNHFLVHSDNKRHKCEICSASFKRSKSLKSHLILHAGLKPYACNFCNRSFSNRSTCRAHMKRDHPSDLEALEAEGNKAYTRDVPTLQELKAVTKSSNNIKPVLLPVRPGRPSDRAFLECQFCESKFTYRSSRRSHIKLKHPEEFALMDPPDSYREPKNLNIINMKKSITMAAKSKSPSEQTSCEYCGRTFGYRKLCQNHIKRIHTNQCPTSKSSISKTDIQSAQKTKNEANNTEYAVESMQKSLPALEVGEGTTATTNIQDLFLLLD